MAIALANAGRRVLLVSTDAASNLDDMLGIVLSNQPVNVPGVPGLQVLNIDPDAAAEAYRQHVLAQLAADFSRVVNEALSAFVALDTAPTGHSLLLMDATGATTGK